MSNSKIEIIINIMIILMLSFIMWKVLDNHDEMHQIENLVEFNKKQLSELEQNTKKK